MEKLSVTQKYKFVIKVNNDLVSIIIILFHGESKSYKKKDKILTVKSFVANFVYSRSVDPSKIVFVNVHI